MVRIRCGAPVDLVVGASSPEITIRGYGKGNFSRRGRYEKSEIQCYNFKKYGHYTTEC